MSEERVNLEPWVREQMPEILEKPFDEAIDALHLIERRTRTSKDDNANCIVCEQIVTLCIEQNRWEDLGRNVDQLSKRRGYSRKSIRKIVTMSMQALDKIQDEETHINLVRLLCDVTEGKIFVEVERARLTQIVVTHLEAKAEAEDENTKQELLTEAMNLLQELRLEILSSMDDKERLGLMLHQFKLCLETNDELQASLCAKKIEDQKITDSELELEFLNLLIRYHNEFTRDFLCIAESYYKIFQLTKDGSALMNSIINAVLAPHSVEQMRFCNDLQQIKDLALMPEAKQLLAVFMGCDLVPWAEFEPKFSSLISEDVQEVMRRRVIEHSLRVVSKYYTNIRLARLAELEQITIDELEERIIDLVFNEDFYARIDRPKGIITFKKQQKVGELADEFSDNIMQLCRLVDQAHSLIEKEKQCIHRPVKA